MSKALDTAIATMHSRKATSSDYLSRKLTGWVATMSCYAILTLDGLDGIEHSDKTARKELKDLKAMGCEAKAIKITGLQAEHASDAIGELIRGHGHFPGAARLAKVAKEFDVVLTAVKA